MARKWKIIVIALVVALLLTGVYAAAAGSEGDPLVTLSYLKNVFTGQIQTMVNDAVTAGGEKNKAELDAAINTWDEKVSAAVDEALKTPVVEEPAIFEPVALGDGKSFSVEAGCEIIVRSGAPVCSVDLIDQTDGSLLAAGKEMKVNHLYVAAKAGKITAPSSVITGVVTADLLNVRAGAGTGYARLGTLNKDTEVTVLDRSVSGWYMISGGGLSGYVSADYVEINSSAGSGPADLLVRGDYKV